MDVETQYIGRIDKAMFEAEFGELQTDEVILTIERYRHILLRHNQDYSYFKEFGADTVNQPDYILKDNKHESTAFLIKCLPGTNISVVIRLAVETDDKGLKNSIMTFHRVRDSNLKKMIKRNKLLYKRGQL